MKKIFIIFIAFSLTFTALGQGYKVTDKSQRSMPDWVTSVTKDYLNVSATGADIEEAKAAVLASVKQQISESIASRIVAESDLNRTDLDINGSSNYSQSMAQSIRTRTAKLPFMGEISLSKASTFYWEKRYYKSQKRNEVFYAVQYPFSEFEMKSLILDFQMYDQELDEKLEDFETGTTNITSIEDIDKILVNLRAFQNEFIKEDPRYTRIEALMNRYRKLYDAISLTYVQEKKGLITCSLLLGDRQISTTQKPMFKTNCATKIQSSFEGNTLVIKYDDFACYPDDENYIEIRFRTGNKYLTDRIYIKDVVTVSLNGIITDIDTDEPISYVKISIMPSGKTTTTGRNGMYQFNDLPTGTYTVQAMNRDYETGNASAMVSSKGGKRLDIQMKRKSSAAIPAVIGAESISAPSAKTTDKPMGTVLNGLSAYYMFNGNYKNSLSNLLGGQGVNEANFSSDSKDGTQSVELSAVLGSCVIVPRSLIAMPSSNYSVSFWIKGISNGLIWSSNDGSKDISGNAPRLKVANNRLQLINRYDNEVAPFAHSQLSYDWHHICVTVAPKGDGYIQCLYIDGDLADAIQFPYVFGASSERTRFQLGGQDLIGDTAIETKIDNLRIYSTRALSEQEVQEIYQAEQ